MFNREEFIKILTEGFNITHWDMFDRNEFCDIFISQMTIPEDDIWVVDQSDGKKVKYLLTKGNYSLLFVTVTDEEIFFSLFDDMTVELYIDDIAKIVGHIMKIISAFEDNEDEEVTEDMEQVVTEPKPEVKKVKFVPIEINPQEFFQDFSGKVNKPKKFTDKYYTRKKK